MESPFSQSLSRKPLQSILVKPTSADCNLACEYCFYLEKAELYPLEKQRRMPLDVMEEMVKQVMETGQPSLSFGWQGGEPTLMGLDFFRKAVECQKKYGRQGQSVGNGLQTNGILITDEWCDFFNEYSFLIGLSLDGPQHVHDRYRFTIGGGPSWRKVEDAAKRMLERGVAVNALSVLNDYSAEYPQEIYEYHKSLGFEFLQFIPCVEPDIEGIKAAPFSVTGEQYGRFLCEIFDLWRKDFVDGKPTISVRYFDSLFHLYVNMPPPECTLLEECGCYVVVEHNGDVYSCDFFVQPEWKLGNLMKGNLNDFLNGDQQTRFGCLKKEIPPECVDCPWLHLCRGGCTKDRISDPSDQGSNHFCAGYKMFFEHTDEAFKQIAEEWWERQREEEEEYYRQQAEYAESTPHQKVGRNDPCPCGSGKKYKKCCGG